MQSKSVCWISERECKTTRIYDKKVAVFSLSVHGEGKLLTVSPSIHQESTASEQPSLPVVGWVQMLGWPLLPPQPNLLTCHFHHLSRTQEDTFFNVPFKTLKTLQWLSIRKGMRNKHRNLTNSLRLGSL